MVEALDDVGAEEEARAARREAPAVDLVRVAPQQVAHGAFVGHFLFAVEEPDLVDAVDERRQATVHAEDGAAGARGGAAGAGARGAGAGGAGFEGGGGGGGGGDDGFGAVEVAASVAGEAGGDFAGGVEDFDLDVFVVGGLGGLGGLVDGVGGGGGGAGGGGVEVGAGAEDEGAEGEVVEHFAAVAPHIGGAVFAQAFVVEAVHGRDLPRFVVAADERDAVWVAHFEAEEEEEAFERVEAAVDEVAHEEVVCVGDVTADAEQLHEVVELAVDVAAYGDGGVDLHDVAFLDQEFSRFVAEFAYLCFGDCFAGSKLGDGSVASMVSCCLEMWKPSCFLTCRGHSWSGCCSRATARAQRLAN